MKKGVRILLYTFIVYIVLLLLLVAVIAVIRAIFFNPKRKEKRLARKQARAQKKADTAEKGPEDA